MSIAIYYGSTTGNTEEAAEKIKAELGDLVDHVGDIADSDPTELTTYDVLIIGIPTWNVGELQFDWEDCMPQLKALDFSGMKVALFGLGDSFGYPDNFLDALGLLWNEIKDLGSPELIGIWPTKGYTFTESVGKYDDDHFLGLGLDEENESDRHDDRIKAWTKQIRQELGFAVS